MGIDTVLLVNLGTPASPRIPDVRQYLREFLNDPRVIDLPKMIRFFLVNAIIVPFRAPRSAAMYREIWTDEGSPILLNSMALLEKLRESLAPEVRVEMAMRYGQPSIGSVLDRIRETEPRRVLILPLFPQYATATTASVLEACTRHMENWSNKPAVLTVPYFHHEEAFLDSFASILAAMPLARAAHVVFSFHGLPVRQVERMHAGRSCEEAGCYSAWTEGNRLCYRAQCEETARQLARRLKLDYRDYTVSFQSRFGRRWLSPFTDKRLAELALQGVKTVLVASPAFTADCLETLLEIGKEYRDLWHSAGGEEFYMAPSLNDDPRWVNGLAALIREKFSA